MKNKKIRSVVHSLILFGFVGAALNQAQGANLFTLDQNRPGNGSPIEFSVDYNCVVSTCTHDGVGENVQGTVILSNEGEFQGAQFSVKIDDLSTFNELRDCHMREALGLNYDLSQFPKDHVCQNDGLPSTGPNSIAYPNVIVKFVRFVTPESGVLIRPGETKTRDIVISLKIHNVTKEVVVNGATLEQKPDQSLVVKGQFSLDRRDFGIVVKPFSLGFTSITVDNLIRVKINLNLFYSKSINN